VSVTTTALSGPAAAAARRPRGAAAREAPGFSQGRLSGLSASGRCHVSTRLDRRPFARRFAAALRDSAPSAAPGLGRGRRRWALSTRQSEKQCFRDWVTSSSQATPSNSRSLASPPVTSQVPEPFSRLFALLPHRKIAKPRYQQYQCKSRPESGRILARLVCCATALR
jgi:hypothetical protein